jgi:hypothetical protein
MDQVEHNPFGLSRAGVLMASWGVLIMIAGIIHQWFPPHNSFSFEMDLLPWAIISVLGLAAQAVCQFQHQRMNFIIWVVAVLDGWAFTYYAFFTNYNVIGEIAPVWLFLLGIAYIPTALQIDTRFFYLAGLHFVAALLFELSARKVITISLLDTYGVIIVAIVSGAVLIAAAFLSRVERPQVQGSGARG